MRIGVWMCWPCASHTVLTNLGEKMSDEEVDELLKAVDTSSGEINYTGMYAPAIFASLPSCKQNRRYHEHKANNFPFSLRNRIGPHDPGQLSSSGIMCKICDWCGRAAFTPSSWTHVFHWRSSQVLCLFHACPLIPWQEWRMGQILKGGKLEAGVGFSDHDGKLHQGLLSYGRKKDCIHALGEWEELMEYKFMKTLS